MRTRRVPLALAMCLLAGTVSSVSQDDLSRGHAARIAAQVVDASGLAPGSPVHVRFDGEAVAAESREGFLEGLIASGLRVHTEGVPDAAHSAAISVRMPGSPGRGAFAVVVTDLRTGEVRLSKELDGSKETAGLERYVVPAVLSAAVALIIYLFLTVRSS